MPSPAEIQRGITLYTQAKGLHASGSVNDAAPLYGRALSLIPNHPALRADYARALDHIARQLAHAGRWEDALVRAKQACALHETSAYLYLVLHALEQLGKCDELDVLVPEALMRHGSSPAIRAACATHLLKAGTDYAKAFAMCADMRSADADPRSHQTIASFGQRWNGKPFAGTLRVIADGGLGDQIIGASMLVNLQQMEQHAEVICETRLLPLFRRSFPALSFRANDADGLRNLPSEINQQRDQYIHLIDLGMFFRKTSADFPPNNLWLRPDETQARTWRADYQSRWPGRLLCGLAWRSARQMQDGSVKSIPLQMLAPLLREDSFAFLNLQYGDTRAEQQDLHALGITGLHTDAHIDPTHDIDALAAQIAALDLVITSSNVTAHLAGALGTPCWLLLPSTRPVLWYWGYTGDSTHWYGSLRIFRNTNDNGDWRELVGRLPAALQNFMAATTRSP